MLLVLLFSLKSVYAEEIILLPSKEYKTGIYEFQAVAIPKEAQTITVSATRNQWPDTGREVVYVQIDYSKDGGRTWANLFGFKTIGGVSLDRKTGVVQDQSWVEFNVPDVGGLDRLIKGRLETYTDLTTQVKIGIP